MRRVLYILKECVAALGTILPVVLVCLAFCTILLVVLLCAAPFACVYGCRAAWTAGGQR